MKRSLLILFFCFSILACSDSSDKYGEAWEKDLRHVHYLIDQGSETEALEVINKNIRNGSGPKELWLTAKAEALVSRAGVRAFNLIQLAENLDQVSKSEQSFHKRTQLAFINELKNSQDKNVRNMASMFGDYLALIDSLAVIYISFTSIPIVPIENVADLAEASVLLSQINKAKEDTLLFRVVVSLLVLKFKIQYNYYFDRIQVKSCEDIDHLTRKIDELSFELGYIASDLKELYPKNKVFSEISSEGLAAEIGSLSAKWKDSKSSSLEATQILFRLLGAEKIQSLNWEEPCQ